MNTSEWAAKWSRLSDTGKLAMEFWVDYAQRHPADVETTRNLRPGYAHTNVYYYVPEANLNISQYLAAASGGVGLYIVGWMPGEPHGQVAERRKMYQAALVETNRAANNLWPGWLTIDLYNRRNWPQAADWLHETLLAYRRIIVRRALAAKAAAS